MTLSERTAYLKGLMEGMKIDTETNEGKLFKAIIETLDDMALTVSDVEDVVDAVCNAAQPIDGNGSIARDAQPVILSVKIRTE